MVMVSPIKTLQIKPVPGHDSFVHGHIGATTASARGVVNLSVLRRLCSARVTVRLRGRTWAKWTAFQNFETAIFSESRSLFDETKVIFRDGDALPTYDESGASVLDLMETDGYVPPGSYQFKFFFRLPDILAPSYLSKTGGVMYELTATIHYKQPVWKGGKTSNDELGPEHEPAILSNIDDPQDDLPQYKITLPTRVFGPGDKITVQIHIASLPAGCSVRFVDLSVKAQAHYRSCDRNKVSRYRIAHHQDKPQHSGDYWRKTVELSLPTANQSFDRNDESSYFGRIKATKIVHQDFVSPLISVCHFLKIKIGYGFLRAGVQVAAVEVPITLHAADTAVRQWLIDYSLGPIAAPEYEDDLPPPISPLLSPSDPVSEPPIMISLSA
ncbi:hypothetical protein HK102_000101 [Quaeritorhiza haematococci]|nr:hypothetical protein HK102_000101 [Quaeritorhiza haematococci]